MYLELEQGSTIFGANQINSTITAVSFGISSFGMFLSILALLLLIITACLFQEWRKNHKNQLLIQFMIARCAYTFVRYFFDIRLILFNTCDGKVCIIYMDQIMMIYTELVLIAWMFVFSLQMYNSLVIVLNPKTPNIWKVSLATWFIPAIMTMTMHALYSWQEEQDIIIYFLYLAILKWPALIANAVILIMIFKSLTKTNNTIISSQATNKKLVIVMNLMLWSFCFQQAFVDIYKLIYVTLNLPSFLFVVFNIGTMYHCAAALLFWVFGNAKTRSLWMVKIRCAGKTPLSPQSSVKVTK